jgi:glycosyltransferase involved in cell wall biosynthesis
MRTLPDLPKVSCLMVTADRGQLCRRAIRCYQRQTYPNKELIVVDDGREDLAPLLADLPSDEVVYLKLAKHPESVLGKLRNVALEAARGDLVAQWDDDDWYHGERLEKQVAVLQQGYEACALSAALMHLDTEAFVLRPYIGYLRDGVPGSIAHLRSNAIRYEGLRRGEDTVYLHAWTKRRYAKLPPGDVYLFIRCFHGNNTWEASHFLRRMRNTVPDSAAYVWHRFVRRDLFRHNRFRLDEKARAAFETYLEDSYELNLLKRR